MRRSRTGSGQVATGPSLGLGMRRLERSDGADRSVRVAHRVPGPTVARLPVYHRALVALESRQLQTVSSAELAAISGVNAATVRRDLSHLGSFGTRGTGYDVAQLLARVDRALGIDREWPIVVVGVGSLGRALARSGNFSARGLRVAALLDVDPGVVGTEVAGVPIEHVDELEIVVRREDAAIAVLTTPAEVAQGIADRLTGAGVRAILNLAPVVLKATAGVRIGTIDLAAELQVLAFYGARDGAGPAPDRYGQGPTPQGGRPRRKRATPTPSTSAV